jgi:polar amino acid transport system ATP-binding protein
LVGEVLSVIEQLVKEGRTMLLVTHEAGFAYHVATRIVFLAEGGFYETGTPDEVLKHPDRPLTKQFPADYRRFQI